jgi:hypothetical protein
VIKHFALFLENIYDGKTLIWNKYSEHEIDHEDDEGYYFIIDGQRYGIGKDSKNTKYVVIQREFE